jgi:hypothetical protein
MVVLRGLSHARFPMATLVSAIFISSCAVPMPAMRADHTVTIAGRLTAGLGPADANRKAMSEAARLTVDHGFRYFKFVGTPNGTAAAPALPGKDIVFKAFHKGEIRPNTPGLWDADTILTSGTKDLARNTDRQP